MAGRRLTLLLLMAVAALSAGASGKSARFELIRSGPASFQEMALHDRDRVASFAAARGRRHGRRGARETAAGSASSSESAFAMPLTSAAYTGIGQYFVRFRVGTPAQPFLLVADTGSDLTWVKCRPAKAAAASTNSSSSASASSPRRAFRPEKSKTWAPIPCASDTCSKSLPFSLSTCPTPGSPCAYDYRYKDGSAARGTVGTESATIALSSSSSSSKNKVKKAKLQGLVLGCTGSYTGPSFEASDGVLSLGYSNVSFASHAASRFGGRFSYCLVDHLSPRNATSYLTFGPNSALSGPCPAAAGPGARQTPLVLDSRMRPFYDVSIKAISVDGELLKIPRDVWEVDGGGGVIVDSGTSLTVLAKPAYRAVVAALGKKLARFPRVAMDPFEYCYNWTSPSRKDEGDDLPKLAVHFAGSARLEPPSKSYVIDAAPGVKCIGVQEGPWPGISVIGNILQQEHLWEFDLKNRRLRFKRSRCTHS
ncbi:aspartic proteinase NANA, chloroplast isoform X1 [Brachypodium distachyon]|uniref:Peptidase A1 domain-containing protein n=1 Tax=Brachypodium distachyon TaxID=15368 RepID=I1HQD6_BRADI|nr:aspartic proteinase NANA, chloroplast isoform X1 [Brachypodium distachyon]KQK09188.1 hypothetical protein BRADI_2g46560v3 [Brachypodium distachyon]|eukprot:XP_003566992.1 aspartic proteinase NANA, chloroplast isoform X1 [Brachypodium distachyon]